MTAGSEDRGQTGNRQSALWGAIGFGALLAIVLALKVRAVYTLNVNWDEFALLGRAVLTARTGEVVGGGRPGLGTLALVPFAVGCENAVDALVQARLLWLAMVVASAGAFWFLLRSALETWPHRAPASALGLAVWVLNPVFLRSSTQVRTDQPAVLFGLLAGLALMPTTRRLPWAAVAGALFGVGFLFSQKLVYVAALVLLLEAVRVFRSGAPSVRTEFGRAAVGAAGFLGVLLAYRAVATGAWGPPRMLPLEGQLSAFEFYREFVGWREYRALLPLLASHLLPLACLPLLTVLWLRQRGRHGREVVIAWSTLALGIAVAAFHAGRFPYFFIVLGLFPATVAAMTLGPLLERVHRFVLRGALLSLLWIPLVSAGLLAAIALSQDTQFHQRGAITFVDRAFADEARGFDADGPFACRKDPDPFPVRFPQAVYAEFLREGGDARGEALIAQFRDRPVVFMLVPQDHDFYPANVREFWGTRYVTYHGPVRIPGRRIQGTPGWRGTLEAVVPGRYVWFSENGGAVRLMVDGVELEHGDSVFLDGPLVEHDVQLLSGGSGIIALDVNEPPAPSDLPFYVGF